VGCERREKREERRMAATPPTTFAAAVKAARDAAERKDYAEVLNHCKVAFSLASKDSKEDPKNYTLYLLVGLAQNKLDKPEQSEAAYRKAVALNASNPLAWHGLFELFSRTGDQPKIAEVTNTLLGLIK